MDGQYITLNDSERKRILALSGAEFITELTDTYLAAVGGSLTADNMDRLSVDQHSLLAYRYLLDEVMEGGFIQLIHNGYAPYVLEGPFPLVLKKMWNMKPFSKLLFDVRRLYHLNKERIVAEMSEEEFMALYEELEELNEYGDDFLDDYQETVTPDIVEYVRQNQERFM